MDEQKYSTLMEAVAAVADPRQARGKRFAWPLLLALICSALASGQRTAHGIADWVQQHARELQQRLHLSHKRLPSEATLRRTLRCLDLLALENHLSRLNLPPNDDLACSPVARVDGQAIYAQALDGKSVRGANNHGATTHLLSLVQHTTGFTLHQVAVAHKKNEISAAPALLQGRCGPATLTTMDALLTQRTIAEQIVEAGGFYLMIVKRNQPRLYDDLELFFRIPAIVADQEHWERVTTVSKGHGRLEIRTLECSTGLCDYLQWP